MLQLTAGGCSFSLSLALYANLCVFEWRQGICEMCACSDGWCKSISRCATTRPSICASGKSAVTMVISGSNPSGICHLGRQTTRKPAGVIGVQEDGERLRGISTTLDLTQFCFKMTRTEKPDGRACMFSYDHTYLCLSTIKKGLQRMVKVNEGQRHAFSNQPGEMHLTGTLSYLTLVELQHISYSLESA